MKPLYEQIANFNSSSVLVKMPGDKFYKRIYFDTSKIEDTQIVRQEDIHETAEQKKFTYAKYHALFVMGENEDKLGFYRYSDGEIFNVIANVDGTIKNQYKRDVLPVYVTVDRGFIVRHNMKGEKFYQIYSWQGEEYLKEKIPAADVEIFNVTQYDATKSKGSAYLPMIKLTNKKNLYWPLMFSFNEYFEQPNNIDGVYIDPQPNWTKDFHKIDKFYVKEGDNVYLVWLDVLSSDLQGRKALITEAKNKASVKYENVADIEFVEFKDVGGDNQVRTSTIALVHRLDGKYQVGRQAELYNSKNEAMVYINRESSLAASKAYKQQMLQYEKDMAKYKREKAAYDESIARQNNFINFIHQNGLGASGNSAGYDAEVYCSYGGPRCESYRRQAQNMQDTHNRNVEAANRNRLNNLYNGETAYEKQQREKSAACRKRANTLNEHAGKRTYTCD
jgi:hypothetical protein